MPAGVTWPVYLRFTAAALLAMFAGSQAVHLVYRPMDDLPRYIEEERLRRQSVAADPPAGAAQHGPNGAK